MNGYTAHLLATAAGLQPDPPLWIDEWAIEHMQIPKDTGAAEPGRYRIERTPYAREPMRALSPEHPARKVVIMGASQLLKTQIALNWVCALVAGAPTNLMILEPSDKVARNIATRFEKTVAMMPVLQQTVATQKSRDARNTSDTKEFRGGTIWFRSARSPSNLAETSICYIVFDEVDRILREIKGEGDPISLGEGRQGTYGRKAKTLYISSPTEEDASRIHELYREGDQRHYYIPCPHCGELQTLEWEHVHYDLEAGRAWYVCVVNGCIVEESAKATMLPDAALGGRAEWRPLAPGQGQGEIVSYAISALYAPLGWISWLDLARGYESARKALEAGDPEKLQAFWNTRLARPWKADVARIQPKLLQGKAEPYPLGIAPVGVRVITATVDVQGNRLEVQIVGWGPGPTGLEGWVINARVLFGDPTLPEVWRELDSLICTPIPHAYGTPVILRAVGIDSGDGDNVQEVYEFCRPRRRRIVAGQRQDVLALKGASNDTAPIISKGKNIEYDYRGRPAQGGVELFQVGPETAADWFMNRLALEDRLAIHTPQGLPLEFYEQLLAEAKLTVWIKGRKKKRYRPLKKNLRNEQFDLMKYNVALAHYLNLDRYTAQQWEPLARSLRQVDLITEALAGDGPAAVAAGTLESTETPTAPRPDNSRHQQLLARLRNRR